VPKSTRNKSILQELKDSCENAEEYYYAILDDLTTGKKMYGVDRIDLVSMRSSRGWCLTCGNPHMKDTWSPYYCKKCLIDQMGEAEFNARALKIEESEEFYRNLSIKKYGDRGKTVTPGELFSG